MDVRIVLVANVEVIGGVLVYTPTPQFAAVFAEAEAKAASKGKSPFDPNNSPAGENADLSEELAPAVDLKTDGIKGMAGPDDKGQVEFPDLDAGLYLILQGNSTDGDNGKFNMQSFLIPIPYLSEDFGITYIVAAKPKIEPKKGSLDLKKEITGDWGYPDNAIFEFTITFTHPDGLPLTGPGGIKVNGTVRNSMPLKVCIRPGETKNITNIPLGTEYVITETHIPDVPDGKFTFESISDNGRGTITRENVLLVTAKNKYTADRGKIKIDKEFSSSSDVPTDDAIEFTVVLKYANEIKYIYKLNKANNWTVTDTNVVVATYTVDETNIPGTYEKVSINPGTITVTRTGSYATVTVTNKKKPPTTIPQNTNPPPGTRPTSPQNPTTTSPSPTTTNQNTTTTGSTGTDATTTQPTGAVTTTDDDGEYIYDSTGPLGNFTTDDEEFAFDEDLPYGSGSFPNDNTHNSQTGDNTSIILFVLFAILFISGGFMIFIVKKKKKEDENT